MSIESQVERINQNIANTYNVLAEAGATMPANANSDNLAETAASISAVLYGKEQSLTEAQKAQARENIGAVGISELFNESQANNYADMSTLKTGLLHTNGTVYTGGSYDSYEYFDTFIPVNEGDVLSLQFTKEGARMWSVTAGGFSLARVVAYDTNKAVVSSSGANNVYSYTVPSGIAFVKITLYTPSINEVTELSIVKNATGIVDYAEYGAIIYSTIKPELIPNNNTNTPTSNNGEVYVSLPDSVHVKVKSTFKVYYRNIISRQDTMLWIGYHNSLTTRYYDDHFTVSASAEGEFGLPWKVYDMAGNMLESGTLTVVATAKTPTDTTTAMVIGDSTVNDGTMTAKVVELYTGDGATLTLLGTRGGGTHEGRGGWTAEMYCTQTSYGGITNPFYNNGFDFSYYMTNQNFSGVQAVAIQLGINDIFTFKDYSWAAYNSAPVLEYLNQMVTSILAYDPSIKVIINLPITPNSNGTSFTEAYGTTQLYWFYNRNVIRFAKELKEYFESNAYVTISASNCILDTKTQIRDGVHPTTEGYNALGQRLYEVLVSVVDGQIVVLPLLDISTRTRTSHSGSSITGTSPRELDTTKCYDEVFNGSRANNGVVKAYTANASDSLSITVSTAGGTGMNFPVAVEAGKTYTLKYTINNTGRVYVMKYNSDTTYNVNTCLSTAAGTYTKTITPEAGYIYGILFVPMVANTSVTFSGISLTEN